MRKNTAMAVAILFAVFALSSAASAQKSTLLRVIVVKTDNVATYVQEVEKGRQLMKTLGLQAQVRVWQAKFAGPEAGAVVVSVEYPNMAAFCGRRRQGQCQQRISKLAERPRQDKKDRLR